MATLGELDPPPSIALHSAQESQGLVHSEKMMTTQLTPWVVAVDIDDSRQSLVVAVGQLNDTTPSPVREVSGNALQPREGNVDSRDDEPATVSAIRFVKAFHEQPPDVV